MTSIVNNMNTQSKTTKKSQITVKHTQICDAATASRHVTGNIV